MKLPISQLRRLVFRAWRRRIRSTLDRPDACSLFGLQLVVAPGVLHPRHFASSRFLGRHLMRLQLRGLRVADIGTGSGLLALLAARAGATVTAVDTSPAALACAEDNSRRNGLADRMTVARSNVFDALPGDLRFHYVITNPPFYPREPESAMDGAFAAGPGHAFFVRLAEALPRRLEADGTALLIHSSDTDFAPVSEILAGNGLTGRTVARKRGLFETLTIRAYRA